MFVFCVHTYSKFSVGRYSVIKAASIFTRVLYNHLVYRHTVVWNVFEITAYCSEIFQSFLLIRKTVIILSTIPRLSLANKKRTLIFLRLYSLRKKCIYTFWLPTRLYMTCVLLNFLCRLCKMFYMCYVDISVLLSCFLSV